MLRFLLGILGPLSIYSCKSYADSTLLQYSFFNSNSQIILDQSGNGFHGTNGPSLASESEDAIWTDRGAYFSGNQYILISPNAISNESLLLSQSFTMTLWVYSLSDTGYMAGRSGDIGIGISNDRLTHIFRSSYSLYSVPDTFLSDVYLDNWRMVSLVFEYTLTRQDSYIFYMDSMLSPQVTETGEWTDTQSNPFLIGKNNINFQGFIYDLFIYAGAIPTADFSQLLILNTAGSCEGFPFYETECLSACEDPYKDKNCVDCGGECNSCDTACGAYCSFTDPSQCIDIRNTFCKPHPFDSNACNFGVTCLDNCYHCGNDTECIECESEFFLQEDLTCGSSCPFGFYPEVSTNQCQGCNANCEECSGPSSSECLKCMSDHSQLAPGGCECQDGYFSTALEPLTCQACHPACATCDGALESNCLTCSDSNAYAREGMCFCRDGYFTDGNSLLVCEHCHAECLNCYGSLSDNCISCSDINCSLQRGKCICDPHTYPSSLNPLICSHCHSNCFSCSGPEETDCLSCKDHHAQILTSECVCQIGYFAAINDPLTCEACPSTCLACNSPEDCKLCKPNNSHLSNGQCLCQDGFFLLSSSQCEECHQACSTCSGPYEADCVVCKLGNHEVQNGVCRCKEGYYELEDSEECEKCVDYCVECTETDCLACMESFELRNNLCECLEFFEVFDSYCYELFTITMKFLDLKTLAMTSEEPIEELTISEMSISMFEERELLSFSISRTSNKNFTVSLNYSEEKTFKNLTLMVNFTYPLFSSNGKLLQNRQEKIDYGMTGNEEESEKLSGEGVAGLSSLVVALAGGLIAKITMDDPSVLWTVADLSQYISYLPLIDVKISPEFGQFLVSYQSFYFFPNLFVKMIPKTAARAPAHYEEYGGPHEEFEDIQFARNGGRFFSIILINILVHAMILCFMLCAKGKVKEMMNKILKNFWSSSTRIIILLYLDLAIHGSVELMNLASSEYIVSMILTLFVASILVLLPVFIIVSLIFLPLDSKNIEFLKNSMNDLDGKSKLSMSFYGINCIRKLVYALSVYLLRDYPDIILGVQMALAFFIALAILKINFFSKLMGNIIHGTGECVLILTFIGYLGIRHANTFGFPAFYVEYTLIGINIVFILTGTVLGIANMITTYLKKRKKTTVIQCSSNASIDEFEKVFARRRNRIRDLYSLDNSNSLQIDEILSNQVNQY